MNPLPHEAFLTALASLDGVGPGRLRWMLSHGSPEHVWELVRAGTLRGAPAHLALDTTVLRSWVSQTGSIDPADCWRRCRSLGVGVMSLGSASYPQALAEDIDPPVVLFHQGDPDLLDARRVAIVGTRRATGYGIRSAEQLGSDLADAGVVVVSGLALGIDAAAHRGALAGGSTCPGVVAVVGGGLDAPCPARNRQLARSIIERGVIFSEVPPGVPAAPWRFPVRNRVLAALADAVIVVESAGAGGSMHTVREAMSRDRPVLAVPGPIDSRASEGTNRLISEGAIPCLGVEDVFTAMGMVGPVERSVRRVGAVDPRDEPVGDAVTVLEAIGWRPVSVEEVAIRSGLDLGPLSLALGELDQAGWTTRTGGWIERRARPDGVRPTAPPGA